MISSRTKYLLLFLAVLAFVSFPFFLPRQKQEASHSDVPTPTVTPTVIQVLGVKSSRCQSANNLPDTSCTPGAIFDSVTAQDICVPGYSKKVRDVSQKIKNKVYSDYGIVTHTTGQYEVDHLISLELGGSNDISNLWPEPADPRPGFHEKDRVENYLHQQVCAGQITLTDAQQLISHDWTQVLNQIKN